MLTAAGAEHVIGVHSCPLAQASDEMCSQDADTKTERLAVEDRLELEPTADWLDAPSSLLLPHGGRTFEVKVSIAMPQATIGSSCWHAELTWRQVCAAGQLEKQASFCACRLIPQRHLWGSAALKCWQETPQLQRVGPFLGSLPPSYALRASRKSPLIRCLPPPLSLSKAMCHQRSAQPELLRRKGHR